MSTYSVLGLSECEACCVEVDVGEGVFVRVVEAPGLILLKAKTYLDRRPDIVHDIRDLDFVVRTYRDTLGDAVVFERASDVLRDEEVDYEDVGAFLLARDALGLGMADVVAVPLRELVAELLLPQSKAVDDVLMGGGTFSGSRTRSRRSALHGIPEGPRVGVTQGAHVRSCGVGRGATCRPSARPPED